MSGFGIFEASVASDQEVGLARQAAADKFHAAVYDVREQLGPALFASRSVEEFRTRVAMMKRDQSLYKVIEAAGVFPNAGMVRRIAGKGGVLEREFKEHLAKGRHEEEWTDPEGHASGKLIRDPRGLVGPIMQKLPGEAGPARHQKQADDQKPPPPPGSASAQGTYEAPQAVNVTLPETGYIHPGQGSALQSGLNSFLGMKTACGPYKSFDACVAANQDKDDPSAFCGSLKAKESSTVRSRGYLSQLREAGHTPAGENWAVAQELRRLSSNQDALGLDVAGNQGQARSGSYSPDQGWTSATQGIRQAYLLAAQAQGDRLAGWLVRGLWDLGPTGSIGEPSGQLTWRTSAQGVGTRAVPDSAQVRGAAQALRFALSELPGAVRVRDLQSIVADLDSRFVDAGLKAKESSRRHACTKCQGKPSSQKCNECWARDARLGASGDIANGPIGANPSGLAEELASPGGQPMQIPAWKTGADKDPDRPVQHLEETFSPSDKLLRPKGDWQGYLKGVDQDGPSKVRKNFAALDFTLYTDWCAAQGLSPIRLSSLNAYAANLTDAQYFKLAAAIQAAESTGVWEHEYHPKTPSGQGDKKLKDVTAGRHTAAPDYLRKADDALTQLLQQKQQEFQESLAPLQQALVTVQQAEQLQQQQNPLNVLPAQGTMNVLPGGDQGPAGMPAPGAQDLGPAAAALAGGAGGAGGDLSALLGGPDQGTPGGGMPDVSQGGPGMLDTGQGGPPPAAAGGGLPPDLLQQTARRKRGGPPKG